MSTAGKDSYSDSGISSVYLNEYWHGTKFERPLRRTLECVEIIRTILAGKRVDYEGEIFRLKGFRLLFKPRRSEIPIYIASMGPKNIELTSRVADGWIPYLCPVSLINERKKALASGGRKITVAPFLPAMVSENPERIKRNRKGVRGPLRMLHGRLLPQARKQLRIRGRKRTGRRRLWRENKAEAIKSISDELLDLVSVSGSPAGGKSEARGIRRELRSSHSHVSLQRLEGAGGFRNEGACSLRKQSGLFRVRS